MTHWKLPLTLSVLVATLASCCCPLGDLLGETEFTTGDFADVPAYPGSVQITESDTAVSAMTRVFSLIAEEAEWKHYTTSDSASDVLDWYESNLPEHGWAAVSDEDLGTEYESENGLFFVKANDPQVMVIVLAVPDFEGGSEVHIIIGRILVSSDEE